MGNSEPIQFKGRILKIVCSLSPEGQKEYPSWSVKDPHIDDILYCLPTNYDPEIDAWFKIVSSNPTIYVNSRFVVTVEVEEPEE